MSKLIKTPVLFITYNKTDTTLKVLNKILKCNPSKLIIVSDGPETNRDEKSVNYLRNYFNKNLDNSYIEKDYNQTNKGLKETVTSSISKYINKYGKLIIIEDDILPSKMFFDFCDSMLDIYKDEKKVNLISGFNYLTRYKNQNGHQFSKYTDIWGWATWDDRWNNYESLSREKLDKFTSQKNFFSDDSEKQYYVNNFENVLNQKLDSWAFDLTFSNFINRNFSVLPNYNLTKNIGLGHKSSTHTKHKNKYLIQTLNVRLSLLQRKNFNKQIVQLDTKFNSRYLNRVILKNTFYNKLIFRILKLLNKT